MLRICTLPGPHRPALLVTRLVVAMLVGLLQSPAASRAASARDAIIEALFGDAPQTDEMDTNGDGAVTAADLLVFSPPGSATPTAVTASTATATLPAASTPTPTGTATSRPTPSATPSPTFSGTPTPTPSPTLTTTPQATSTATQTATPVGLLFAGTVSDLLPHAVGDQLVYKVTDPTGKVSTETTIVTSSDPGGAFVVDDRNVRGQTELKHETQSYTDTGSQLLFTGGTDVRNDVCQTCAPGLVRLVLPVIAGQTTTTSVTCEVRRDEGGPVCNGVKVGFVDRTDTFTPIRIIDSLTVEAGTYRNVIHIEGSTELSGDVEVNSIDIAPGIGAVLRLSTFSGKTTRRELIDGTIGGVSVKP